MRLQLYLSAFLFLTACHQPTQNTSDTTSAGDSSTVGFAFANGYPTDVTIQKAYYEADLNRAIQCYRFFYPTVSILAVWDGNMASGCIPNKTFAIMGGGPGQIG